MSAKTYRVLVSENRDLYPNKAFIDFGPVDSFNTHAVMLAIRRKYNPKVECLTDNLLMHDFGNNDIRFEMEQTADAAKVQNVKQNVLTRYAKQILDAYHKMQEAGQESTLSADAYTLSEIFSDVWAKQAKHNEKTNRPSSAKEQELADKAREYEDRERRREDLKTRTKYKSFENAEYLAKYYDGRE
jgi:hypothetical protein